MTVLAIDPIAFRLLGWPVHWYGIIIGCGMVVSYWLVHQEAKRQNQNMEAISDIYFWTIIFGLIGARTYYVLFRLEYYLAHPDQIIQIWQGGGAIYGAIIAGAMTLCYLSKRYSVDLAVLLDISAPAILIAQAIGRWGNFINQEAYGTPTTLAYLQSWHFPDWLIQQMFIQGQYYHPTFLYESLWSLLGCLLLLSIRHIPNLTRKGEIAAMYFIWYGVGRFFIEGLRTDSLYLGQIRISQLVSVCLSLGALIWLVLARYRARKL